MAEVPSLAVARRGYQQYLDDCERGEVTFEIRFHNKRTGVEEVGPPEELIWKGDFWHTTGRETAWSDGVQITRYGMPLHAKADTVVLINPRGMQDSLHNLLNPWLAIGKRVLLTPLTLQEILLKDEAHVDEVQSSSDLVAVSCAGITPVKGPTPWKVTAWLDTGRRFAPRKMRVTYDLSHTESELAEKLKGSFYEIENTEFRTVSLPDGRSVDFPVAGKREDRGATMTLTADHVVLGTVDETRLVPIIPEGAFVQDTRGPKPRTYQQAIPKAVEHEIDKRLADSRPQELARQIPPPAIVDSRRPAIQPAVWIGLALVGMVLTAWLGVRIYRKK